MTGSAAPAAVTRRAVVLGAGGVCAAALAGGCGGSSRESVGGPPSEASTPPTSPQAAAPAAALARADDIRVGTSVAVKGPDGQKLLVTRTGPSAVVAFSAVCTHQGCTVEPEGMVGACPCHGSRFDLLTGKVTGGPASRPLPSFPVRVVNGEVLPV